jgi:hypothetical protein
MHGQVLRGEDPSGEGSFLPRWYSHFGLGSARGSSSQGIVPLSKGSSLQTGSRSGAQNSIPMEPQALRSGSPSRQKAQPSLPSGLALTQVLGIWI